VVDALVSSGYFFGELHFGVYILKDSIVEVWSWILDNPKPISFQYLGRLDERRYFGIFRQVAALGEICCGFLPGFEGPEFGKSFFGDRR
jgi:hypothetical protein